MKMSLHNGMIFVTKKGTIYLIGEVEGNSIKIYPQYSDYKSNLKRRYRFSNSGKWVYKDFIDRNAIKFL